MDTILVMGGDDAKISALRSALRTYPVHLSLVAQGAPVVEDQAAIGVLVFQSGQAGREEVLATLRAKAPALPFVVVGKSFDQAAAQRWIEAGADDYFGEEELGRLIPVIRRASREAALPTARKRSEKGEERARCLLAAVRELSLAKDLPAIHEIAGRATRRLTGAQGATFILKDGDNCYYADEDTISPLWRGQRFPIDSCIGGWVMTHKEPVVMDDIYQDSRISQARYRPTFVKSLLVVPIRANDPIGAIGSYWSEPRHATSEDVESLQILADATAVAIENVQAHWELENRVKESTRLLNETNRELQTFSYSISHDLRSPITAILGFAQILSETIGEGTPDEVRSFCNRIIHHAHRMSGLIRDVLRFSRVAQIELKFQSVDLSRLASEVLGRLKDNDPTRPVRVVVSEKLVAQADPELAEVVLENLLSNAWKYTGKKSEAMIEFGGELDPENGFVFFVRDNGAGFNPAEAKRLFAPFQRLHDEKEFAGIGIGLAMVQRIVHKHGGRVWATGEVDQGATFFFTFPPRATQRDCSRAA